MISGVLSVFYSFLEFSLIRLNIKYYFYVCKVFHIFGHIFISLNYVVLLLNTLIGYFEFLGLIICSVQYSNKFCESSTMASVQR
jgi:hypothetical protein